MRASLPLTLKAAATPRPTSILDPSPSPTKCCARSSAGLPPVPSFLLVLFAARHVPQCCPLMHLRPLLVPSHFVSPNSNAPPPLPCGVCQLQQQVAAAAAAAAPARTMRNLTPACRPPSRAAASAGLYRSWRTGPPPSTSPVTARYAGRRCPVPSRPPASDSSRIRLSGRGRNSCS